MELNRITIYAGCEVFRNRFRIISNERLPSKSSMSVTFQTSKGRIENQYLVVSNDLIACEVTGS